MGSSDECTDHERETLHEIADTVNRLNQAVEDADANGYVVELRLVKTKPGYPAVRYQLMRKIG